MHRAWDDGYRANGQIQGGQDRRTSLVVVALVAVVGLGVLLAALRNDGSSLAPLLGDLSPTMTPAPQASDFPPGPTTLPRLGILGAPLPERPIPMMAGWLQWLDPRTGEFGGDPQPSDLADQMLTFADAVGDVVQVCTTQATRGGSQIVSVDICAYDADGRQRTHFPVAALRPEPMPLHDGQVIGASFAIDATVDRSGRWLWVATSAHLPVGWDVSVHRIDLAAHTPAGSRQLRVIPTSTRSAAGLPAGDWRVADTSTVRPVVRASPDGSRLSVTITEMLASGVPVGLLQQERVEFDGSLEPSSPLDVVFPVGTPSDLACDASRAGWATDHHYLTLCRHSESNGDIQPFVRIEIPLYLTRDVAIGPAIPAADQTLDDSSWLLDAQRGVLHRWSSLHHTMTSFDVENRAGTTVALDLFGPPPQTGAWPMTAPGSGPLVWASLDGGAVPGWSSVRLVGSADGTILYALGLVPVDYGVVRLGSTIAVINARTDQLMARWDNPGPADQLGLAPGGGPLVEFLTPRLPQSSPTQRGPILDWTTQAWFVDQRTGAPLEVLGELRGPGATIPVLLQPVVAGFAGF